MATRETKTLPLDQATEYLLEECRMVLPGIQALFGFQLIAVFNNLFKELGHVEQSLHLAAIGLVAIAIALIMTPAALHRQTSPREVSQHLIALSTKLLLFSMFPLATAVAVEFYIVSLMILHIAWLAGLLAVTLLLIFIALWFVFPRSISQ